MTNFDNSNYIDICLENPFRQPSDGSWDSNSDWIHRLKDNQHKFKCGDCNIFVKSLINHTKSKRHQKKEENVNNNVVNVLLGLVRSGIDSNVMDIINKKIKKNYIDNKRVVYQEKQTGNLTLYTGGLAQWDIGVREMVYKMNKDISTSLICYECDGYTMMGLDYNGCCGDRITTYHKCVDCGCCYNATSIQPRNTLYKRRNAIVYTQRIEIERNYGPHIPVSTYISYDNEKLDYTNQPYKIELRDGGKIFSGDPNWRRIVTQDGIQWYREPLESESESESDSDGE